MEISAFKKLLGMFYPNKKGVNSPKTISRYSPFMDELTFINGEKLQLSMESSTKREKRLLLSFFFWAIFAFLETDS
jgi:hypothetical protein